MWLRSCWVLSLAWGCIDLAAAPTHQSYSCINDVRSELPPVVIHTSESLGISDNGRVRCQQLKLCFCLLLSLSFSQNLARYFYYGESEALVVGQSAWSLHPTGVQQRRGCTVTEVLLVGSVKLNGSLRRPFIALMVLLARPSLVWAASDLHG